MCYNEERIQKIKKDAVKELSLSEILNQKCKEVWIFGSSIKNISNKKHTPFSDLDIGVLSDDVVLNSENNKLIVKEIYKILKPKNIQWDLIWIQITNQNSLILQEIKRGERII